jgi:hypothetical protein
MIAPKARQTHLILIQRGKGVFRLETDGLFERL